MNKKTQKEIANNTTATVATSPPNRWLSVAVKLLRLVVGSTLIFSGIVKLIDPVGTMLKIDDYLAIFNLQSFQYFSLPASILLSLIETVLGFNTLLGSYLRSTPRLLLVFMSIMTPFTLYLAIANPISDCGCFGDAVVMSNWESFAKNVVLLILTILLVLYNRKARSVYHREVHLLIDSWVVIVGLFIAWLGCEFKPFIDFRPYKVGTNLAAAYMGEELPDVEYDFIYEKEGDQQVFSLDNLPDEADGWQFIERIERGDEATVSTYNPQLDHFVIYQGNEDVTEEILLQDGYVFMLFSPDVTTARDERVNKIHDIHDYCREFGYPFYAVTASSPTDIEEWLDNTGGDYSFLFMDKTTIYTIARNNPFVMILKDGVIYHKLPIRQLPDESLLVVPFDEIEGYSEQAEYDASFRITILVLLGFAIPLLLLYFTERVTLFLLRRSRRLYENFKNRNKKTNI